MPAGFDVLQSRANNVTKSSSVFLLQSGTIFITKWVRCFKVGNYYKVEQYTLNFCKIGFLLIENEGPILLGFFIISFFGTKKSNIAFRF